MVAERARMKDRLNKKNWTLQLSGNTTNLSASVRHFTDDSAYKSPTNTPVGPRYNIISGALGVSTTSTTTFGWYYPNVGCLVFDATGTNSLSSSIPGSPAYIDSGSSHDSLHNGFAPELNNDGTADNAFKFVHAIYSGSLTFRNEEDQTTISYFCRAKASNFNFSNNPTFVSGSDSELRNPSFEGNPQTFITTVGLYDSSDSLVAVGRLSKPIQKNFDNEAVVKVLLTY